MKDLIEQLGRELLAQATKKPGKGETTMATKEKVDIFKATSLWYVANLKTRKGEAVEEHDGETFDQIAKRINGKGATAQ